MAAQFIELIGMFFYIAIFARIILSWLQVSGMVQVGANNPLVQFVFAVTEPILGPIRRFIPNLGMIDISPMVAMILIFFVQKLLLTLVA